MNKKIIQFAICNPRFAKSGQSTLEILIAVAVIAISLSAIAIVISGSQSLSVDTQESNRAVNLARENIESAIASAKNNFSGLVSDSSTQSEFLKETIVQDLDSNTKKITSRVSWSTEANRTQKVELTTLVTKWEIPPPFGSNCAAGVINGDWAHPQVIGSGDLGAGNEGTDVAVSLPYVYVSGTASSASKPDIFVFDVSNPNSPQLVKSLDIGSGGINSIFIKGNYLYAASPNDSKELIIFNISNPSNISQVSSLDLPGNADAIAVTAFGTTTVAIGRSQSSDKELYFINATNPASPAVISSTDFTGAVNDFALSANYLYAVSSAASQDIRTYDITNSLSPSLVSTYDLKDGTEDISISFEPPNNLFVGNLDNKLVAVDASNLQNMSEISSISTGGSVKDTFCVVGNLLFLATTNSNKEFMIIDISNPAVMSEYASLNFPQVASGIDFANNKVFMSVRSNDSLKIITSSQ